MDTSALWQKAARVDPVTARWYLIAFHKRFALPTACLVLALVGIPLGLSSKKSGKSGGFVLTILLVFVYYVISLVGVSLARQGRVPPWFGAWLADFVFLALALFLLFRAEKRPIELASFRAFWKRDSRGPQAAVARSRRENAFERASTRRRMFSASFPTLLDDYVLRDFFVYLGMILSTFLVLVIVFTLFELLGDILRNQVPASRRSGIPAQRHALSALQRRSPGHAARRAGHLRPDAALQRNHRDQGHRNQHLPHRHARDRGRSSLSRRHCFSPTSSTCPAPTSARKLCTTRSKASLRRPTCVPIANGFSARTTTSTTTSSSIPIATSSATSPSFSSILPASPSPAASTPTAPTGPTI